MFAPINFGMASPGFFHVAALYFKHISGVEPSLQMTTTGFALIVLLVAGALADLFGLYLMMRKLRRSWRGFSGNFPSGQRICPSFVRLVPPDSRLTNVIVLDAKSPGQSRQCRMLPVHSTNAAVFPVG